MADKDFMDQTGQGVADAGKDPTQPNVLLICCDHLRADWLGCNGHPLVMTPQLDKLAAAGVNFRGAFSECPVCVPARRILMTGLNPYGIHMRQNVDAQPFPEGPKLAEVLTRAGYQTFAAGKLHVCPQRNRIGFEDVQLNEEGRRQGGLKQDDYEAFVTDAGYGHLAWTHGLGNNEYGLRLNPLPEKLTTTHWTAQKAMEFIERRDPTRPFFLYAAFDKPHPPIVPPAEYYELYRDVEFPAPVMGDWLAGKTPSRLKQIRLSNNYDDWAKHPLMIQQSLRGFAAMITHIDSMIGNLVGQLREHGLFHNTWIIFTSDHGDQLFDHGNLAKGDFFCGSTNVPLLVIPPTHWRKEQKVVPGRVHRAPAGLMDVMPTILDACHVPLPATMHGESLLPVIKDDAAPFRSHTCGVIGKVYGVTDGRYKYQWFAEDDLEFLFDVQNDLRDRHDLAGKPAHKAALKRCRQRLIEWLTANNDPQVKAGKLVPCPREWNEAETKATNHWNNRGRH